MDKIAGLREFIRLNYDPKDNGDLYWETGNYDDTYAMGCAAGYAEALLGIGRRFLDMELPDIATQKGL